MAACATRPAQTPKARLSSESLTSVFVPAFPARQTAALVASGRFVLDRLGPSSTGVTAYSQFARLIELSGSIIPDVAERSRASAGPASD